MSCQLLSLRNEHSKRVLRMAALGLVVYACGGRTEQFIWEIPPEAGPPRPTESSVPDAGGLDAAADADAQDAQSPKPRERCNGLDDDEDGNTDEGCPIRLTYSNQNDFSATVDAGRVVWLRSADASVSRDAYYIELPPRGPERRIADGVNSAPSLHGNHAAFWSASPNIAAYRLVDLNSSKDKRISVTGHTHSEPHLFGNWVLWSQEDPSNDPWGDNENIYKYDIATGETSLLVDGYAAQSHPVFDGENVFWSDMRNGHHTLGFGHYYELWTLNVATGKQTRLTQHPPDKTIGWIQAWDRGRVVVYEQRGIKAYMDGGVQRVTSPESCDLVLFHADGERKGLSDPKPYGEDRECPWLIDSFERATLRGNYLIHEIDPGGASDLELVDLRTMRRTKLTDHPRRSQNPKFDGRYLVWADSRNDNYELYYMDLIDIEEGDLYPEGISPPPSTTLPEPACKLTRNACGECAPPALEECNGRDDDCNGEVDEGCSQLWPGFRRATSFRLHGDSAIAALREGPWIDSAPHGQALVFAGRPGAEVEVLNLAEPDATGARNYLDWHKVDFDGEWAVGVARQRYAAVRPQGGELISEPLGGSALLSNIAVDHGNAVLERNNRLFSMILPSAAPKALAISGGLASAPDISGSWVVFEHRKEANSDSELHALNTETGEEHVLSRDFTGKHLAPVISGTRVVWTRETPPSPYYDSKEVYFYDLATGSRRKLGAGSTPRISGGLVCWIHEGVWLYDLQTDEAERVSTQGSSCDVAEKRVGWIGFDGLTFRDLN